VHGVAVPLSPLARALTRVPPPHIPLHAGEYKLDVERKTVAIHFEQTQLAGAALPVFAFALEVEVTDGAGTVHHGVATFAEGQGRASVHIPLPAHLPAKVALLRVDPGQKVLFTLDMSVGEELLGAMAKSAGDIPNRVWAYRQLCTLGTYAALTKMRALLIGTGAEVEPYFGVRVKVAQALAKVNTHTARDLLLDLMRQERDPRAQWSIIQLANQRSPEHRQALLYALYDPEAMPYRALAAALENLGRQRHPDDLQFLLDAARNDAWIGQHGIVRAGALRALGQHRSEPAFRWLVEQAGRPGSQPDGVWGVLLTAIAAAAPWQATPADLKAAIELLRAHVATPHQDDVRWRAIQGLVDLEARAAAPSILATRPLWDERDFHVVKRRVRALQLGGREGGKGLQELAGVVEGLEGKLKKMEALVEKLSAAASASGAGGAATGAGGAATVTAAGIETVPAPPATQEGAV
jgi:aminopeptidase N